MFQSIVVFSPSRKQGFESGSSPGIGTYPMRTNVVWLCGTMRARLRVPCLGPSLENVSTSGLTLWKDAHPLTKATSRRLSCAGFTLCPSRPRCSSAVSTPPRLHTRRPPTPWLPSPLALNARHVTSPPAPSLGGDALVLNCLRLGRNVKGARELLWFLSKSTLPYQIHPSSTSTRIPTPRPSPPGFSLPPSPFQHRPSPSASKTRHARTAPRFIALRPRWPFPPSFARPGSWILCLGRDTLASAMMVPFLYLYLIGVPRLDRYRCRWFVGGKQKARIRVGVHHEQWKDGPSNRWNGVPLYGIMWEGELVRDGGGTSAYSPNRDNQTGPRQRPIGPRQVGAVLAEPPP